MPEINNSKYLVQMDWNDVPHLSDDEKQKILDSTPIHIRAARSKGIPSMGAGAIYPIPEDEITVESFKIPDFWPRAGGMDVGWNRTAAIWAAIDRENGVTYLTAEYYRSQAEPVIHSTGIKTRGDWIPLAIDPASAGSSQVDGKSLLEIYRELGLDLVEADNAVEAGIHKVWNMLSTGELKVFNTLRNFFMEYRLYRRDEKGKVIKEHDHLMDSLRYLVMTGLDSAITKPRSLKQLRSQNVEANPYTGY